MCTRCLALVLLVVGSAGAQEITVEHQASLDPDGRLLEVSPALRRQLGLFPEIAGYRNARLLQADDSTWVLEISYQLGARLSHQRRALSPAAVEALRRQLALRTGQPSSGIDPDPSARGQLIATQMLLSLAFYGPAVPMALGLSQTRSVLAGYMLTSAAGFYLPYRLTRRDGVTPVQRQMTWYGATRGAGAGLLLERLLLGDRGNHRTRLGGAVAGSVVAAAAGYGVAGWRSYDPGQAQLGGVMADFGALAGGGGAYVAGLFDGGRMPRSGSAALLAGGGLGLLGGDWLSRRLDYSQGDAYVLRAGGVLGALAALPLVNALGTESGKAHAGGAVAGMGAGVGATSMLLRAQEFTFGQGLIITGGQVAGGLLGLGLTYLLDTRGHFDELAYLTSAAAGSAAGFTLTFRAFSR
jgi:hypothetical protein